MIFGLTLRSSISACRPFSMLALCKKIQDLQPKPKPSPSTLQEALKLLASEAKESIYAKVVVSGRKFTISPNDIIITHKLVDSKAGDIIKLDKVFELGTPSFTLRKDQLIAPEHHRVIATVLHQQRGQKVFRKIVKRRKLRLPSKNLKPHFTVLRIKEISVCPIGE
jgi:ribosomal protein L21